MKLTSKQKQEAKPMPPFIRPLRDAIRQSLKKQTRRLSGLDEINQRPDAWTYQGQSMNGGHVFFDNEARTAGHEPCNCIKVIRCPYGEPGEVRYLRESIRDSNGTAYYSDDDLPVFNPDTAEDVLWRWQRHQLPQIHMPKIYARTFCKMISIRCERAQDISEKDAKAEATHLVVTKVLSPNPEAKVSFRNCFESVWRVINGSDSWDKNPFVWVLTFATIKEK